MPKKKGELSIEERLEQSIVAKEEMPYKLPSNWVWTRLGNVLELKNGVAVNSNEYGTGDVPLVRISNIQDNKIDLANVTRIELKDKYKKYLLEKNDLLLAMSGATTGKIGIFNEDIVCVQNQRVGNLKIKYGMSFGYRNYYFQKMQEELLRLAYGGAQPNISGNIIENLLLPLPPLEEQKRIVEKLDSLFEKIQKIKEIIEEVKEKTTSRREAILSKAFSGELTEKWRGENHTENARELLVKINDEKLKLWEDECKKAEDEGRKKPAKPKLKTIDEMLVGAEEEPYKLPNNWVWTKVGNITNYGEVKQIKAENIPDNSWILELEDIEKETFKVLNKVLKKDRPNKSNKHIFFKGDILYSKLRPYLNKIVIAEDNGYATTEIIPFKGLANLNNKYIFYYFSFSKTLETISFLTHGMQMPRLGTDKAKNLLFPLPPLEEQKEIVRVLDKVFEEENRISELISLENKIEILEKTILDRAFRGELGTGNNDDEPAIELLKKCLEGR